jgi:putative aminopeptidase FrvX
MNTIHVDADLLGAFAQRFKTDKEAAAALGVSEQSFNNWKRRGIPASDRARVERLIRQGERVSSAELLNAFRVLVRERFEGRPLDPRAALTAMRRVLAERGRT